MLLRLLFRLAASSVALTGCQNCMRDQSYSVGNTLSSSMPTPTAAKGRANKPITHAPGCFLAGFSIGISRTALRRLG